MSKQDDPEWEVVDSLPNEKKNQRRKPARKKTPIYRCSLLWIGLSIGLLIAFAFPPLALILRRLLGLWWLALMIAGYYSYKKYRSGR